MKPAAKPAANVASALMLFGFFACGRGETGSATDTSRAGTASTTGSAVSPAGCVADNGGITLPAGFCASVFADTLGHVRHIAVNANGDVYVNTWSGRYYTGSTRPDGFLVAMRDTNNDGRADVIRRFGPTLRQGNGGGTGIAFYKNMLYAEQGDTTNKRIVRYAVAADSMTPTSSAEVIVDRLPASGGHPTHPFVIDARGTMFVNVGSATNSCQVEDRTLESPGRPGCPELRTRAGIWRYDANKTNQRFSPAERYATGSRNSIGIALDGAGQLHATQHGRDQLFENWPKSYNSEQGQNQPAEELLRVEQGDDYGWPYCYFDGSQRKLVLAPEYGGDGGKKVGICDSKTAPEAFFPAHWAPNGLMFYTGSMFPERYRNGAFIAFHGSWNRAPGPQEGYNVVFVPFSSGKPADPARYEVFADGFAGARKQPDAAAHRPVGIAQAPDGGLYITDDKAGRIWKVIYRGTAR